MIINMYNHFNCAYMGRIRSLSAILFITVLKIELLFIRTYSNKLGIIRTPSLECVCAAWTIQDRE